MSRALEALGWAVIHASWSACWSVPVAESGATSRMKSLSDSRATSTAAWGSAPSSGLMRNPM